MVRDALMQSPPPPPPPPPPDDPPPPLPELEPGAVAAEEIALSKDEPRLEVNPPMSREFQPSPLNHEGDCAAAWVANTVAKRSAQCCSTPSASAAGR